MDTNWATEHLQVIRTLMERSAIYRHALAPIMLLTGSIGLLAAAGGYYAGIELPRSFAQYWLVVALVAATAAFVMVRLQALKDSEPFWSPATRRVAQALMPPFAAGFLLTVLAAFGLRNARMEGSMTIYAQNLTAFVWLPAAWILFYGCALHAAGFFMPRGMKLFGWALILGGSSLLWLAFQRPPSPRVGYAIMGLFFGGFHLAYGAYLYFTEKLRKTA